MPTIVIDLMNDNLGDSIENVESRVEVRREHIPQPTLQIVTVEPTERKRKRVPKPRTQVS